MFAKRSRSCPRRGWCPVPASGAPPQMSKIHSKRRFHERFAQRRSWAASASQDAATYRQPRGYPISEIDGVIPPHRCDSSAEFIRVHSATLLRRALSRPRRFTVTTSLSQTIANTLRGLRPWRRPKRASFESRFVAAGFACDDSCYIGCSPRHS